MKLLLHPSILFFCLRPICLIFRSHQLRLFYRDRVFCCLPISRRTFFRPPKYTLRCRVFYRIHTDLHIFSHLSMYINLFHAFDFETNHPCIVFRLTKHKLHNLIFYCPANFHNNNFHLSKCIFLTHFFCLPCIFLNIYFRQPKFLFRSRADSLQATILRILRHFYENKCHSPTLYLISNRHHKHLHLHE